MKFQEEHENFERVLESAVVVNWTELMRNATGIMQIEYGLAPDGTVDYLEVWSSVKRGYWLLSCTYLMSASPTRNSGVHFDNGYKSKGLADILEVVMHAQDQFGLTRNPGGRGLVPILAPTLEETAAATGLISGAIGRVHSSNAPVSKAHV
jgi:hypothetical protein